MDFDEYQDLAMRTRAENLTTTEYLDNAVLGIAGEAGEIAEVWKKFKFHGKGITETNQKLLDEAGDVLWYLALLASSRWTTIEEIATKNIEKLKDRWPDGFKRGDE